MGRSVGTPGVHRSPFVSSSISSPCLRGKKFRVSSVDLSSYKNFLPAGMIRQRAALSYGPSRSLAYHLDGRIFVFHSAREQLCHRLCQRNNGLRHRGQGYRPITRDRQVVKPDDANILGNGQSPFSQGTHRPDRHFIAVSENSIHVSARQTFRPPNQGSPPPSKKFLDCDNMRQICPSAPSTPC